jgi:hypothetical protein
VNYITSNHRLANGNEGQQPMTLEHSDLVQQFTYERLQVSEKVTFDVFDFLISDSSYIAET